MVVDNVHSTKTELKMTYESYCAYRRSYYDHFEAMREAMLDEYDEEERIYWTVRRVRTKRTVMLVQKNETVKLVWTKRGKKLALKRVVTFF